MQISEKTLKEMDKRRSHFERLDHDNLMKSYWKARKEGDVSKAEGIALIIQKKYNEGNTKEGWNYGNEIE